MVRKTQRLSSPTTVKTHLQQYLSNCAATSAFEEGYYSTQNYTYTYINNSNNNYMSYYTKQQGKELPLEALDVLTYANTSNNIEEHERVPLYDRQDFNRLEEASYRICDSTIENYLKLPHELFLNPGVETSKFDPNALIDEFCKLDLTTDLRWVLDIELGNPKHGKMAATYDAKRGVIACKKDQKTHPGFAECNKTFKQSVMFYYDSIISAWYIGYMYYYKNNSVDEFQVWLSNVMDKLGLCWR